MGETAAIPKGGMRRGQNSPVDKSSEKTSPGALERKKSFPVPNKSSERMFHSRFPAEDMGHAQYRYWETVFIILVLGKNAKGEK
jgi:hypothetical protein